MISGYELQLLHFVVSAAKRGVRTWPLVLRVPRIEADSIIESRVIAYETRSSITVPD